MNTTKLNSTWIIVLAGLVLCLAIAQAEAEIIGKVCDLTGEGCRVVDGDESPMLAKGMGASASGTGMAATRGDRKGRDQGLLEGQQGDTRGGLSPRITLAKGSDHAPITIIAYLDFRCPPCARAARVLDELMKAYPDEIRVVFKHYPSVIYRDAILAHEAAMAAAEQGRFWEMQERLFSHKGKITQEALLKYAKQLDLNTERFLQALQDRRFRDAVVNDGLEAKGFGVRSAPTFFINGRKLIGPRSVSDFQQIIVEELGLTRTARVPQPKPDLFPKPATVEIDAGNAPSRGPEDAPIVIIEFSDFQCPFCAKALPRLNQVLREYPGQVRWVFKHYPLPFHRDAPLAHAASMAAEEQGKFWEMHDLIFANQRAMKRDDLIGHAKELGLDLEAFERALESDKYKSRIDQDIAQGQRVGVRGTPTFFINGEKLVGAKPVSTFRAMIEKHLRQVGVAPGGAGKRSQEIPPSSILSNGKTE